jgi:hypothetical protein
VVLDLRIHGITRDRTDECQLGGVLLDSRQDGRKTGAARGAQPLHQLLVQQAESGSRLRSHRHHAWVNQHLINGADIRQIAVELAATLVDEDEPVNQVLRWVDDAKGLVAVREVVLTFHDQKARQRPIGHVGGLQSLPKVQRRGGAVDAGTRLVDGAMGVVVLGACVLHPEIGGTRGGVQLSHQIQDLAHVARRALAVGRCR